MRDQFNNNVVANLVAMLRADIDGAIVLVDADHEGQFYERLIHQTARVVPSQNNAVQLLTEVQVRRVAGVVAAVTGPIQIGELPESVFQPAFGDVASILLASASCEKVMEEVGGTVWLRACAKEVGSIIDRAVVLASSIPCDSKIGEPDAIRLIIAESIDWQTLLLKDLNTTKNSAMIAKEYIPTGDRCSRLKKLDGMLAVEILAQCTQRYQPRGLQSQRQCSTGDLLSMMRLSFDISEIESDAMFWQMRKWERDNKYYPLLRQWRLLDPLQAVLDQRYWEPDLQGMLERCKPDTGTVAIKLDLDNFKHVNEVLGHASGDAAIRLACSITKEVLSGVGEVYRRGGDEIVSLSPSLDMHSAKELAERLRGTLEERFAQWGLGKGLATTPTASIGLIYADSGSRIDEVTVLLDEAQSRAKREGKNRVVVMVCHAICSGDQIHNSAAAP